MGQNKIKGFGDVTQSSSRIYEISNINSNTKFIAQGILMDILNMDLIKQMSGVNDSLNKIVQKGNIVWAYTVWIFIIKISKNFAIFAIGNFGSKVITLLMLTFYTRILSRVDYGQIEIIIPTLALLMPILKVNIVEAVVRLNLDKKTITIVKH